MSYQRGNSAQPGDMVLSVEHARRRNAEMRIELAALLTEQAQLEAKTRTMRDSLTAGYRKLSRQIRELDAVRAQADNIAAAAQHVSTLPPPKYGGREGLQAATDEMRAHEDKQLKLSKAPRPRKAATHGTSRMYDEEGCRCDECKAWNTRKSAQGRTNRKRRRELEAA
jgi:hypothetical protein